MKLPTIILLVVLLTGCATPSANQSSTQESRVLEIARQAVKQHDGPQWARNSEYGIRRHGNEWIVRAVLPTRHFFGPPTYGTGQDVFILIDEHGTVTSYKIFYNGEKIAWDYNPPAGYNYQWNGD
jgi:hypothetical protein